MDMATLDDTLHMRGLAADARVGDVMDIQSDLLCYTYV